MTVAIIYGWCEGPHLAKDLKRELEANGHELVRNIREAEVIVAHSLGCYLIPKDNQAKKIILVGMPYRSPQFFPLFFLHKMVITFTHSARSKQLRAWLRKSFWNVIGFFTRPLSTLRARHVNDLSRLPSGSDTLAVIFAHNKLDRFITPRKAQRLAELFSWKYVTLPGHHDDLWMNPERYISLI